MQSYGLEFEFKAYTLFSDHHFGQAWHEIWINLDPLGNETYRRGRLSFPREMNYVHNYKTECHTISAIVHKPSKQQDQIRR